jgi:hypothetical protein
MASISRLCIAAALGLLAATPAVAAPRMELGTQDHKVFVAPASERERKHGFERMAALGMSSLRVNVSWAYANGAQATHQLRPARVTYRWKRYDAAVRAARRRGVRVQLVLAGPAPAWATGDHRIGGYMPDPKAFGQFARAAARHFRGRVTRFSIWNEPNHGVFLSPQLSGYDPVSPGVYRPLYRAGYAAIKSVAPRAQVLIGETCPCGTTPHTVAADVFIRVLACRADRARHGPPCAPLRTDGFAHHPYQEPEPPEQAANHFQMGIGSLRYLTAVLDSLTRAGAIVSPRGGRLPVYLTEFGYHVDSTKRPLPERTRASYLPRAFEIAYRNPRVRQMIQYQLVSSDTPGWDTGIIQLDDQPDPVFEALRSWARRRGFLRGPHASRWRYVPARNPTGGTRAE